MRKLSLSALALCSVVLLTACTQTTQTNSNTTPTATTAPTDTASATPPTASSVPSQKVSGWPDDVPVPATASGFHNSGTGSLQYMYYSISLGGKTLVDLTNDQLTLLTSAGWTISSKDAINTNSLASQTLSKGSNTLSMSAGITAVDGTVATFNFSLKGN